METQNNKNITETNKNTDKATAQRNYKILRIVTLVQSAVILIAVILVLMSGLLQNKDERLLVKGQSADGAYIISIFEVGKPNWFHNNTVKAYYSDVNHRHDTAVFTAEVDNGKEKLEQDNYYLEWEGDTAILYLEGSKQTRTAYKINFDTVK